VVFFFFSSRRRHTRSYGDWSSDVCSSDLDLIAQLAKVDPSQEAGLQHFWDKAWGAYARGDLNGAIEQLTFIRDDYRNPNVKRQKIGRASCREREEREGGGGEEKRQEDGTR